jgi:metal-responsive CopG/Arc/MetJ family transcriptional regulator
MESVRINISLPREVIEAINREVAPRQRSRFIREAVIASLDQKRAEKLAAEYEEAAKDIRRVNMELEGTLSDGLD